MGVTPGKTREGMFPDLNVDVKKWLIKFWVVNGQLLLKNQLDQT